MEWEIRSTISITAACIPIAQTVSQVYTTTHTQLCGYYTMVDVLINCKGAGTENTMLYNNIIVKSGGKSNDTFILLCMCDLHAQNYSVAKPD